MLVPVHRMCRLGQQVGKPQGRHHINFPHLPFISEVKFGDGIVIKDVVVELIQEGIVVNVPENGIAKALQRLIAQGLPPPFITRSMIWAFSTSASLSGRM